MVRIQQRAAAASGTPMGHETLLYGFIAGSQSREIRRLQQRNEAILAALPEEDGYPYLTRSMFSFAGPKQVQGTYRTHVFHFGGSISGLDVGGVPTWVGKFEGLLSRLYWCEAAAHIWTDYIDGCYFFWWKWKEEIMATYESGDPQPTTKWIRCVEHVHRHLHAPPGGGWYYAPDETDP